jgi:hypothetical protein
VPPSYSQNFKAILDANNVPNERHTYDTSGLTGALQHNLHQTPAFNSDMLARFRAWLTTNGVLASSPPPAINHRPTISWIADQRAAPAAAISPISFEIGDAETAANALVISAASSNPALLPTSAIVFSGSGSTRTATLTPTAGATGLATITLTVTDAAGKSSATSFTLTVASAVTGNTPPVLQAIAREVLPAGTTYGPLPLVVKDTESAESTLVLSASSTNTGLVPTANIVFGGQNWGRTVTVNPAAGQTGRTTITLSVSDGVNTSSTSFVVEFVDANTPPAVSGLPSHSTAMVGSTPKPIAFAVSDSETAAGDLHVTATSSNTALVPNTGIALSGSGATRAITITPSSSATGAATITVAVTDGEITRRTQFLYFVVDDNAASAQFDRPRGIFVLDSATPATYTTSFGRLISLRAGNIRTLPFVDGYTLRVAWDDVEGGPGQYDFFIIENLINLLPPGQRLSLIIVPGEPAYIAATPGVQTWNDGGITRAVPWDPFLRQRRRAFLEAMAAHEVGGIPLGSHPKLDMLDPYLPGGFTGIRDPNSTRLRDLPGYSRPSLLGAVQDELRALQTNFPGKFVQIGFWPITDNENASYGGVTAWEWLRQQLLPEFNGVTRPRVGFFMENLAARRAGPAIDPFSATPVTGFASALFASRDATWNGFQMLGSWTRPFNDGHVNNTLNGTPHDALEFAFNTYGAEYHEVYVGDIDHAAFHPPLQGWHDFFASCATTNRASDEDRDGLPYGWEKSHGLNPRLASGTDGAEGDSDGDGVINFLEYAFGQDPNVASTRTLPVVAVERNAVSGERYLTLTFLRRVDAPQLVYNVESAAQPIDASFAPAAVEVAGPPVPTGDGVTERVTMRVLPALAPDEVRRFARLRVSDPPRP